MYQGFKSLRRNSNVILNEEVLVKPSTLWNNSLHDQEIHFQNELKRLHDERIEREKESALQVSAEQSPDYIPDDLVNEHYDQYLETLALNDELLNSLSCDDEDILHIVKATRSNREQSNNPFLNHSTSGGTANSTADGSVSTDDNTAPMVPSSTAEKASSSSPSKSLPKSKMREKLLTLSKYVLGHTCRKIMLCWSIIDARFMKSTFFKSEIVKDSNGISHPVRQHALPLSVLTGLLCSIKVKVSHTELNIIYERFKCKKDDIFNARKISVIRSLLGPNNGKGIKQAAYLQEELAKLPKLQDEKLISCEELKAFVFPSDPLEVLKIEENLKVERQHMNEVIMEEKKKKEEEAVIAESRRKKNIADYDSLLREIQYVKGAFTPQKHSSLVSVIDFCVKAVEDHHAEKDLVISKELISLLGLDAFPLLIKELIDKAAADEATSNKNVVNKKKMLMDSIGRLATNKSMGYCGEFRILLQGPPMPVLVLIKETVSYCKGLNGVAYRDVIEWLQAYASIRLQAAYRAYKRRWRYYAARDRWRKIFHHMKYSHYNSWATLTKHNVDTRRYCFRSLVAWNFYVKRLKRRREYFKVCHWPFYVWRRYCHANLAAKEKSFFLTTRVMPTVTMMHIFRSWKGFIANEVRLKMLYTGNYKKLQQKAVLFSFLWLRRYSSRRKGIRRAWLKEGYLKYLKKRYTCIDTPFQIWRAYAYYKILLRSRSNNYAYVMRAGVFKQPPRDFFKPSMKRKNYKDERDGIDKRIKKLDDEEEEEGNQMNDGLDGIDTISSVDISDSITIGSRMPSTRIQEQRKELSRLKRQVASNASKRKLKLINASEKRDWSELRPTYDYDIDSDGEDIEDIPPIVHDKYRNAIVHITAPTDISFIFHADKHTRTKITSMVKGFTYVETWAMIESAFRYHIYAKRVFWNMYVYAKVSRNARVSQRSLQKKMMRRVFGAFLMWMMRDSSVGGDTEGEKLKYAIRSTRLGKMIRRRDHAVYLKNALEVPTKEERRKSVISSGLVDQTETYAPGFVMPDFLAEDRSDRDVEQKLMDRMMMVCNSVKARLHDAIEHADKNSIIMRNAQRQKDSILHHLLVSESVATQIAVENEVVYVSTFKTKAADNLVSVLVKIHLEVLLELLRKDLRKYFRALRIPLFQSRSNALFIRKKLVNWMRICRRLMSIYRRGESYHKARKQWVVFNKWLKIVEEGSLDATPGFANLIKHRLSHYRKQNDLLKAKGFVKTVYIDAKRLLKYTSTIRMIFHRWVVCIYTDMNFLTMERKVAEAYRVKLMQKCFYSIKNQMKVEENVTTRRCHMPYVLVRLNADIDILVRLFVAHRKRGIGYVLTKFNRKFAHIRYTNARNAPRFKVFMEELQVEMNSRLLIEHGEMISAFEKRGRQEFVDVIAPTVDDNVFPILMIHAEGRKFTDPPQGASSSVNNAQQYIPGGYKIKKLRLNFQGLDGGNIVGWQLLWCADSCGNDIEGPKRGRWKGGSNNIKEIIIPTNDFIVGLEYLYEDIILYGIRLKLHHGGWTPMTGKRHSLSTLSLHLDVNMHPREQFEDEYIYAGKDEQVTPGYPRRFIIGFTGIESPARATCLGLIIRKIKEQSIFSYTWVNDALAYNVSEETEMAFAKGEMANTHRDLHSLPSIVAHGDGGGFDGNDSLTLQSTDDVTRYGNIDASDSISLSNDPAHNADSLDVMSLLNHKKVPLTKSEEQFFDVLRMRTTELKVAEKRASDFAVRVFKSTYVRNDPVLCKLVTVSMISKLTKWLVLAISKRLLKATVTQDKGNRYMHESSKIKVKADLFHRRQYAVILKLHALEAEPQSWQGKLMLPLSEKKARKEYYHRIQVMKDEIVDLQTKATELLAAGIEYERIGKLLLPRLHLSAFVCNNYLVKVAASRHKEVLLERMTFNEIKDAMAGTSDATAGISLTDMLMLKSSISNTNTSSSSSSSSIDDRRLQSKNSRRSHALTLDEVATQELSRMTMTISMHNINTSALSAVTTAIKYSNSASDLKNIVDKSSRMGKGRGTIRAIPSAHVNQTKKIEYINYINRSNASLDASIARNVSSSDPLLDSLSLSPRTVESHVNSTIGGNSQQWR